MVQEQQSFHFFACFAVTRPRFDMVFLTFPFSMFVRAQAATN
jgi:hypothetical protein